MNSEIIKAKNILTENGYTCVVYYNKREYHSTLRGVKPLIQFLESDNVFNGFYAADKVVGAGAAHLYVLLGVKAVWTNIISDTAKTILQNNNITVFYENIVPYIINRTGDGVCPIEAAVSEISDSKRALEIIKLTLK